MAPRSTKISAVEKRINATRRRLLIWLLPLGLLHHIWILLSPLEESSPTFAKGTAIASAVLCYCIGLLLERASQSISKSFVNNCRSKKKR